MTVRLRRPSAATVIASVALFAAVGGPAEAARLINGKLIRKGTVSSKQIRNHGVTTTDLSRSAVKYLRTTPSHSVGARQLADGAVGAAQLQGGSVTAGALAANSITAATLADGIVGTTKIADNAVTTEKIATSAVRKGDIASGAVGQSEIATNAVATGEVADGKLGARDLAEFSGTLQPPAQTVAAGACTTWSSDVLVPNAAGAAIADDLVLIQQPSAPVQLKVTAAPSTTESRVILSFCNPTAVAVSGAAIPAIPYLAIQP